MNTVICHLEEALCWTVLAPLVRARRRRYERKITQELHDRQRIDRVLNDIVRQHADLLC
jgi:DNA-binding transcriptional LysR family regulator